MYICIINLKQYYMGKYNFDHLEQRINHETEEIEYYDENEDDWVERDELIERIEEREIWDDYANNINQQHGGLDW